VWHAHRRDKRSRLRESWYSPFWIGPRGLVSNLGASDSFICVLAGGCLLLTEVPLYQGWHTALKVVGGNRRAFEHCRSSVAGYRQDFRGTSWVNTSIWRGYEDDVVEPSAPEHPRSARH
jgi:hypothetical protein